MSQFDRVIREFHQKRLEKDLNAQHVRHERVEQLREMAQIADLELRQRKTRKQHNYLNPY